jgi:hypothetical protein
MPFPPGCGTGLPFIEQLDSNYTVTCRREIPQRQSNDSEGGFELGALGSSNHKRQQISPVFGPSRRSRKREHSPDSEKANLLSATNHTSPDAEMGAAAARDSPESQAAAAAQGAAALPASTQGAASSAASAGTVTFRTPGNGKSGGKKPM